jgi:hypothetical protein
MQLAVVRHVQDFLNFDPAMLAIDRVDAEQLAHLFDRGFKHLSTGGMQKHLPTQRSGQLNPLFVKRRPLPQLREHAAED